MPPLKKEVRKETAPHRTELADSLKDLRQSRRLSLQQVADMTGVSKSMLSKIELGRASPTATILGKIAEGLGISISQLIGGPSREQNFILRVDQQPIFRVPATGFERRSLTPTQGERGVDVALNMLPPGQSSGFFPPHREGVEEILNVASGQLIVYLNDEKFELGEGDTILYAAQRRHRFDNPSEDKPAIFYIVVDNSRAAY
jgi:transcriptional regulator with XRE-family HTH domain